MKFCPKCRSFYDDESLAFCLADGVPLIKLNSSNELWEEGSKAVETSRQIIQKQTRRQKFKRISRILITTVMMILVISVIAMNIYIYTLPNEEEKVENIAPSPTKETPINVDVTPLPTASVTATPTPKKTATPIVEDEEDEEIKVKTTDEVLQCSAGEKIQIQTNIKSKFYEQWRSNLMKSEGQYKYLFSNLNKTPFAETGVYLDFTKEKISVLPNSDCSKASGRFSFQWLARPISGYKLIQTSLGGNKSFRCKKIAGNWNC